jgi:peptidoglycan/xylan/chitin deacetylase (PgdA/CDA1 family)
MDQDIDQPARRAAGMEPEAGANRGVGEPTEEAEAQINQAGTAEKPQVLAVGDWVTTERDVDLRPVAVATDRGLHAGVEARLSEGVTEISFSDRAFANSRDALRHAWDFYEGGDEGLELAVSRAAAMDRDLTDDVDLTPSGLVLEHRDQPEFPRPETAIYAGEEAQLVLTLGRDTEASRDLAQRLFGDPGFRQLVAEHIPDAEATLGTGRFVDGEGSAGFLPDELLAVTSYGRDGSAAVLARFPDEGPLSEALARHLAKSPVLAAHAETEQLRSDIAADPERAISAWVAQSNAQIDRLPPDRQEDFRSEMQDIAKEITAAFGLDRDQTMREAPPRSTLYSTTISSTTLTVSGEETGLQTGSSESLAASLSLDARLAGIDTETLQKHLGTGAANAREESSWVNSDLSDVAKRHGYDLDTPQGRNAAAERLDRFYERAAELIRSAHGIDLSRTPDPMVEALDKMAKLHAQQGSVAFRNETHAQDFADEMKERYGTSVLQDMAAGRTDALAKDVPDASTRQAMAAAVISAAKEHPSLGLSAHEVDAAERRLAADAAPKPPEHARAHVHDRARAKDREF